MARLAGRPEGVEEPTGRCAISGSGRREQSRSGGGLNVSSSAWGWQAGLREWEGSQAGK